MDILKSPEFYYWYLLPTAVGLIVLFWTIKITLKKRGTLSSFVTTIIVLLLGLAQWILVETFFFAAWPTFLPHIATGVSVLLVIIQFFKSRH